MNVRQTLETMLWLQAAPHTNMGVHAGAIVKCCSGMRAMVEIRVGSYPWLAMAMGSPRDAWRAWYKVRVAACVGVGAGVLDVQGG